MSHPVAPLPSLASVSWPVNVGQAARLAGLSPKMVRYYESLGLLGDIARSEGGYRLYGQSEVHSLDALTHRLGITIPEEARHTAIGDTIATADAFLKLLPTLKARGLTTFGAVLAEVRKHGRLMKDLNG